MTISHNMTIAFARDGETISKTSTISSGGENNLDESIPDSSTDLLAAYALDISQVKSFFMVSDQALTVETNDGATPGKTFTLVANKPVFWHEDMGVAIGDFLGVDVTALYFTNSSGSAALIQIRCLVDPTV